MTTPTVTVDKLRTLPKEDWRIKRSESDPNMLILGAWEHNGALLQPTGPGVKQTTLTWHSPGLHMPHNGDTVLVAFADGYWTKAFYEDPPTPREGYGWASAGGTGGFVMPNEKLRVIERCGDLVYWANLAMGP